MLNLTAKNRSRIKSRKNEKSLYKLMDNAIYGKAMENLKNKIDEQWRRLFEMDIKSKVYISKNIWQ